MNHIDVQFLGHFSSNQVLTRNFNSQPSWHSFCLNVLQMEPNAIPNVDFSQKKVLIVPSLDTDRAYYEQHPKSRYQFYTGCSLHPRTKELEIHFYACEPDAQSQIVLKNALIVLAIPKEESFSIVKDKFDNKMAKLQPTLASLHQRYLNASVQEDSSETHIKNRYVNFLSVAGSIRHTYLGKCLNP